MTTLGIALIVCGLTLVCGSMIFRLFRRQEPTSSQEGEDRSAPTEHIPNDRRRGDQQHPHDHAPADPVHAKASITLSIAGRLCDCLHALRGFLSAGGLLSPVVFVLLPID